MKKLSTQLVQRFKDISMFEKIPSWAWQFNPPIPLIGEKYKPGKSILIYASAENLSWLHNSKTPSRFSEKETAWNRYRICYEEQGQNSTTPFPNVGIQPMTDGGLFAASLFLAERNGLPIYKTPRTFLETLAVSNWCKFSIKNRNNRDYINNIKRLTVSLPFVIAELVLLQPKIVLIPFQIWNHPILNAAMRGASPKTHFLPVPQFNAFVVNFHMKKYRRPAVRLKNKWAGTTLAVWMENLKHINQENAWRYIAMLASILQTAHP
ncbi:MAG: hypothetical protein LLF92_03365 [Planctomycetaceae bacterium]|nr:hypothetical protein [Planctomycetaceae bacterium]